MKKPRGQQPKVIVLDMSLPDNEFFYAANKDVPFVELFEGFDVDYVMKPKRSPKVRDWDVYSGDSPDDYSYLSVMSADFMTKVRTLEGKLQVDFGPYLCKDRNGLVTGVTLAAVCKVVKESRAFEPWLRKRTALSIRFAKPIPYEELHEFFVKFSAKFTVNEKRPFTALLCTLFNVIHMHYGKLNIRFDYDNKRWISMFD